MPWLVVIGEVLEEILRFSCKGAIGTKYCQKRVGQQGLKPGTGPAGRRVRKLRERWGWGVQGAG